MFNARAIRGDAYQVELNENTMTLKEIQSLANELNLFVESEQKAKRVIGFTGLPGAGKDTFATILSLVLKERVTTKKFAAPLKEAVASLCDLSLDQIEDREFKEAPLPCGKSPRQIMQLMGTEFVRNVLGADFFVQTMAKAVEETSARFILITDVRFQNEVDWIHSVGGAVVRIERPGLHASGHVSDAGVQNVDWIVPNIGDLKELKTWAHMLVNQFNLQ